MTKQIHIFFKIIRVHSKGSYPYRRINKYVFLSRPDRSFRTYLRSPCINIFNDKQTLQHINIRCQGCISCILCSFNISIDCFLFRHCCHIARIGPEQGSCPLRVSLYAVKSTYISCVYLSIVVSGYLKFSLFIP